MQSPYLAFFARMAQAPLPQAGAPGSGAWEERAVANWQHCFKVDFQSCVSAHDLGIADEAGLRVLSDLFFLDGDVVVSDAPIVSFVDFATGYGFFDAGPAEGERAQAPRPPAGHPIDPSVLARNAWLATYLEGGPVQPHAGGGPLGADDMAEGERECDAISSAEEEGLASDVFAELEARRHLWFEDEPILGHDFRCSLLGGAWLQREKGLVCDAFQAKACTTASEKWCLQHGLLRSARFNLAKFGEGLANTLATEWARRMQFFYDLWLARGDPDYAFTAADIAGYKEPPAFTAVLATLEGPQLVRALQVRDVAPRFLAGGRPGSSTD